MVETYTDTLIAVSCHSCGITFGMQSGHHRARRDDHETFYCPNGHGQYFPSKSAAELLAEEKARTGRLNSLLQDERNQHHKTERRLIATRGVVTRTKKRIVAGLCPKCHEHFPALAAHIKTAHPGYDPEAEIELHPEARQA